MKLIIFMLSTLFLFSCAEDVGTESKNPNHKLANWSIDPNGISRTVNTLDGQAISFESIGDTTRAKAYLLNFFHPDRVSCTLEAKEITEHYQDSFADNDFHIISVGSYTTPDEIIEWKTKNNINYTVYIDEDGSVIESLTDEIMFPLNFFLSRTLVLNERIADQVEIEDIITKLTTASKGE